MEQNKTGRYVKYAVGEIILVVFGILIALQINNWNEHRKDRIIEKKILEEVLLDMKINRSDIEYMIKISESRLNKISQLNDHLINRKQNYDSLGLHLRESSSTQQFKPRMIGYESLNAKGVDVIQNDILRNSIIRTYGLAYPDLVMEGREFEQFDNPTKDLLPYLKKYLVVDKTMTVELTAKSVDYSFKTYGLAINNYVDLLDDNEFFLILQKSMFNRANKIAIAKKLARNIANLEDSIKEELQ